jgi:6-pyruvoyltetrahydropterin/6-carboxytetrahydropterin synthase
MPYATVVKKSVFDSAHKNTGFGEGHKCSNIHGHTFNYEVAVKAKINEETGLSIDFGVVKEAMKERVDKVLDHQFLNELPFFPEDTPPSAENITWFIFKRVQEYLDGKDFGGEVQWVKLDETPTSSVIIRKEDL